MPRPRPGESQQDFVSRCIPVVIKEGRDQKVAAGKCYGMYRQYSKQGKTLRKASRRP